MVLLTGLSIQQCTTGCLKCNSLNQCQLCDVTNNFRLQSNTCQLNTLVSCLLANQDNTCAVCINQWYLDANTKTCVQVASASVVANCITYSSSQVCTSCGPNYYLNLGACVALTTTTPFCRLYSADAVCSLCEPGYVRSSTDNGCVALPTGDNCLYYTFIKCIRCNPNFVQNNNLYFTNWSSNDHIITQYLHPLILRNQFWNKLQVCQQVTVKNCLEASAFSTCTKCEANYYLQAGSCFAYPDPSILNCATYSNLSTCTSCKTGFYLNGNVCIANTVIPRCVTYQATATTQSICTLCENGFFVSGGACAARSAANLNIANCDKYTPAADTCQTCAGTFRVTDDGSKCLASIANCLTYQASTGSNTAHTCTVCSNGFYVTTSNLVTVCTSGSVANCLTYATSANTCVTCQNQYFLNGLLCTKHVDIASCKTYNPTTQNVCNACNSGFYPFKNSKVCNPGTLVSNCKTYNDLAVCTVCNDKFYLSGTACVAIPVALNNCLTAANDTPTHCTGCDTANGWVIANVFTTARNCTQVPDYITNGCKVKPTLTAGAQLNNAADNTGFCEACGDYSVPFGFDEYATLCVNPVDLKLYANYNAVLNCKRYGTNIRGHSATATEIGNNIVCKECSSGYFLIGYHDRAYYSTTQLTCSQTCNLGTNVIVHDNYYGFNNLCISQTSVANTDQNTFFYVSTTSSCQKLARYKFARTSVLADPTAIETPLVVADKENNDYACYLAKTNTVGSTLKHYLGFNGDETFYTTPFQGSSASNPYITAAWRPNHPNVLKKLITTGSWVDFGGAYSNTVDKDSIYPTVFNYLGILPFVQAMDVGTAVTANYKGNNLDNCDIIYKYSSTNTVKRRGFAFNNVAAQAAKYEAATITDYKLTCWRCAFGYMLSYGLKGTAATNPAFPSCVFNGNCASPTTVMGGLPTHLNTLFSCHVCGKRNDDVRLYPSVWIETDAAVGANGGVKNGAFVGWSIKDAYVSATVIDEKHGFKCAPAPDEVYFNPGPTDDTRFGQVINCAAFGYVTPLTTLTADAGTGTAANSIIKGSNTYNQIPICLACAANTYPTYQVSKSSELITALGPTDTEWGNGVYTVATDFVPTYLVKSCLEVKNCDRSVATSYNSCSRCIADDVSTGVYYAFVDHLLAICGKSTTANCFTLEFNNIGDIDPAVARNCEVCKSGYYFDVTGLLCIKLRVPNMPNTADFGHSVEEIRFRNLAIPPTGNSLTREKHNFRMLTLLKVGGRLSQGPSECNKDYVLFPALRYLTKVCVWSSGAYNFTDAAITSDHTVRYCKVYRYGTALRCHECVEGYIPRADRTVCVAAVANCVLADDTTATNCDTCVSGYTKLTAGSCAKNNIDFCLTHATGATLSCTTCFPGFYRDTTNVKCLPGRVQNCKTYTDNTSTACTACLDNFTLISLNGGVTYCYPVLTSLNCKGLDPAKLIEADPKYECLTGQCSNTATSAFKLESWVTSTTLANSVCMPFSLIPNCKAYSETDSSIVVNTFACTECLTSFWYSSTNFTCSQRYNSPSQCTEYEKTSDLCKTCDATTYLSADFKRCVLFPTGVAFCSQYSSATTCTLCQVGYYLSNNACLLSTVIANCAAYSNQNVCSACETGFFLTNPTTCTVLTAIGCLTASNLTTCASCSPGFGLKVELTLTNCVNNLALLNNCVLATQVFPFNCTLCSQNYYLTPAGECLQITRLIPSCRKYDSATTCEVCTNGTVLNLTRTSCEKEKYTNQIDGNCLESQLLANPACTQCASGFYFSGGVCVACSSNNFNSGCLSCDPTNNGVCLVCRPTFYMNSQGACVSSSLIVNNPTGTNTPQKGSSIVNRALTVTLTLATLYYDQL